MIPGSANALLLSSAAGAGGYEISRSLRFNSADSAYLSRTPASAGNRKTWTWAGWVKRGSLTGDYQTLFSSITAGAAAYSFLVYNSAADSIVFFNSASSTTTTAAVFRDPSAWAHVCLAVDTTQATVDAGYKLYINGELQTWASVSGTWTQNADLYINSNDLHTIGSNLPWQGRYFAGYLAEIHFIDGQALDPTSFGEFDDNGIWQPIEYTGTYGTNGFYLDFSDNSTAAALGTDSSGNGNTWTVNNLSVTAGAGNDSLVDVPTNGSETDTGVGGEVRGNYCTWNPLDTGASISIRNGNLDAISTASYWNTSRATFGISTGRWYWEITNLDTSIYDYMVVGIANKDQVLTTYMTADPATAKAINYTNTLSQGDIVACALDMDAGTLQLYLNGVANGSQFTGITGTWFPAVSLYPNGYISANFGQRPFAYTAPSGFKALCTANLPAPTIEDGSTAMDVVTYTGNGSTQSISGLGFSPDLVWIKGRSGATWHGLWDQVRGTGKFLSSNSTNAEGGDPTDLLSAFNSDGFSVNTTYLSAYNDTTNANTGTYVAWTWDAGSSTVTNNDGSITSSVRANPSAGFSILTFTGGASAYTVGHGLSVAPSMIMLFERPLGGLSRYVYHQSIGSGSAVFLNSTAAASANTWWNNTSPTSSVFSVGATLSGGYQWVAYCFAPVAGYSAFGSYTGNGNADGPFVYTGFRPRWVMIKCSSAASTQWGIYDAARSTSNAVTQVLLANASDSEYTVANMLDLTSNGFKLRDTNGSRNASAATYIYAAFAEHPFALARAR